jgi:hypothetical protein
MFIQYNANPNNNLVGDCVIRSIATVLNKPWEDVYAGIVLQGFIMHDMPSSNSVWKAYLNKYGYTRHIIPNTCPDCYTVKDFCKDNPVGNFVLGTGTHAIAIKDGNYIDTWDSGNEIPIYYFERS